MAMVSKGTINVARMSVRTSPLPRHRIREMANPAMLLMISPAVTVTAEMKMELKRKRPAGTRSKTPS